MLEKVALTVFFRNSDQFQFVQNFFLHVIQ